MNILFATLSLIFLLWGFKQQSRRKTIESENKRLYGIIKYYRDSNNTLLKIARNVKPNLGSINKNENYDKN